MRFIIYGAGGIGSIMGGHLVRTGHEVVLIGRSGHMGAINNNGLHLITPTGTYVLNMPAVTSPDQVNFTSGDVVFLCMKGQDTERALKDLKKVTKDTPVFCFQNGVRNEKIAAGYFPNVYGVMVRVGAVFVKDGEVTARRDPPGWYIIGKFPTGIDELAEAVAKELRVAGYLVKTTSDVMPYKWGKLMGNLENPIVAISSGDRESARPIYRATVEEAQAVLKKAGIKWIAHEQVAREWPEIETLRGSIDTEARSSTWQSLARRQGSVETEFLNGEIVRVAKRLGLKAPVNEKLVQITLEMAAHHEMPGKYTSAELSRILGLPKHIENKYLQSGLTNL